jgi:tetratricopeptide (TPR) repeat protein
MTRAWIARLMTSQLMLVLPSIVYAETKQPTQVPGVRSSPQAKPPAAKQQAKPRRNARKPGKGVVGQFSQAMKLYDSGKFNEALVAFDRIHRSYPAHEPTIVHYAKTLYRLDRIPDSYNMFARINPQYLDPETSYEYGYAFYIQNKYENALFAFKRVPADHALSDLANYYGAMCAVRLKRYAEAEELLDKAVVLPDKLARSKTLYQKHVATLRQLNEKADLERVAAEEKMRLANDPSKQPPKPTPAAPAAEAPTEATYSHAGFFAVDRHVKISYNQTSQSSDLHGYSRKTYQSQTGKFEFAHGPIYPFGPKRDGDRRSAVGLQLEMSAASVTSEGVQDRLVAYENSRDIVLNLRERLPKNTTTNGDIGGIIWVETPLPAHWWIGADAHMNFTYPNFQRGQRFGVRGATARLAWKNSAAISWNAEFLGTYDLIVDSEAEPITAQMISDSSITASLPSSTSIKVGTKYVSYDYKNLMLPGPDSSLSGTLEAKQKFPLGFEFTLTGTLEHQDNFIARNLNSVGAASARGQIMSGFARIKAAPLEWLSASAKYTISKSTWAIKQKDRIEAFKAATPDYSETTEIVGTISFLF